MLKRVGVLALMLTAGGLFLQPVTAAAAEFNHGPAAVVEQKTVVQTVDARFVRDYKAPVAHREERDQNRDRARVPARRDVRVYAASGNFCR